MDRFVQDLDIHPDFFEPFEHYKPSQRYFDAVAALLPKMWRLQQDYFWTYVLAPKPTHPVQGWKIHVSTLPDRALYTLEQVTPICLRHDVEFKFASDPYILGKLLSKLTARSAAGKFVTIYPKDEACFHALLEELHEALKGEKGPYILSDRRYKDSKVVFYRYGGIQSLSEVDASGTNHSYILDDRFNYVKDNRAPYFALPSFVKDLVEPMEKDEDGRFCDGKYQIDSVIRFSNAGGVYKATRLPQEETVIVKEARPHIGLDDQGADAIARLEKEFRLLRKLSGTGIAPEAYDLFWEWEHCFLAQELVAGEDLRAFGARTSKLIHAASTEADLRGWFDTVRVISKNVLELVQKLHEHQIVFGDLSLNNLLVDPETLRVKLIDFEGACEPGVDPPVNMYTPGFGRNARRQKSGVSFEDDIFALGCLLMSLLMPITALVDLKEDALPVALEELTQDLGLPKAFREVVLDLVSETPGPLAESIRVLSDPNLKLDPAPLRILGQGHVPRDHRKVVQGVIDFTLAAMEPTRRDRLFPTGVEMTSPLALDHGALGVIYALHRLGCPVPEAATRWVLDRFSTRGEVPGFLNGLSGMACALYELGHREQAEQAMASAKMHRLLYHKMNLGHGVAGYGLANLRLWQQGAGEAYLQEAIRMGDILCEAKITAGEGFVWEDPEADMGAGIGLYTGGSGIALFLLYLYGATENSEYLEVGEGGLRFDLSHGRVMEGSFGFPWTSKDPSRILYPYLEHGSAGVGTAVVRYYAVTRKAEYLEVANQIEIAVSQKYTVFPGLFSGLAGLGNYLLDAAEFLDRPANVDLAKRTAEGLRLFEVHRETGIAFPGDFLRKLNTGYAGGSAGIALFLHRLETGGPNFNFMLDDLIRTQPQALEETSLEVCAVP